MTNKEALDILHNASVYHPNYLDALNIAIKALEQEPGDAISKASVFEILGNLMSIPYDFDRPITKKDISESIDEINALPSILPQQKMSQWIRQTDDYHDYYECEYCGIAVGLDDIKNYCPNCGHQMFEL